MLSKSAHAPQREALDLKSLMLLLLLLLFLFYLRLERPSLLFANYHTENWSHLFSL